MGIHLQVWIPDPSKGVDPHVKVLDPQGDGDPSNGVDPHVKVLDPQGFPPCLLLS